MTSENAAKERARKRSIALWNKCQAAKRASLKAGEMEYKAEMAAAEIWNAWAGDMLAQRKAIVEAGKWESEKDFSSELQTEFEWGKSPAAKQWLEDAFVNFSDITFKTNSQNNTEKENTESCDQIEPPVTIAFTEGSKIDFSDFIFPSVAWFSETKFCGDVWFTNTKFFGNAWFHSAQFSCAALFLDAQFSGTAAFENARFYTGAWFNDARFCRQADFSNAESKTYFDLGGAVFNRVPDFTRLQFTHVPRVDRIWVKTPNWLRRRDKDAPAKFRALKNFAIEQHDYDREIDFFSGELKSERFVRYWPWHAHFWSGVAYQILSDFGRSMLRPFLWWIVSTLSFAALYVSEHMEKVERYSFGLWQYLWGNVTDELLGASLELSCIDESASAKPIEEAIYLAVQSGLLAIGGERSGRIKAAYHCLYGETADIPLIVSYATIGQMVISAVLIFLFLLAIRNHFRIK